MNVLAFVDYDRMCRIFSFFVACVGIARLPVSIFSPRSRIPKSIFVLPVTAACTSQSARDEREYRPQYRKHGRRRNKTHSSQLCRGCANSDTFTLSCLSFGPRNYHGIRIPPAFVDANPLIFLNMNWIHPALLLAFLGDRHPALTVSAKAEVLEASCPRGKAEADIIEILSDDEIEVEASLQPSCASSDPPSPFPGSPELEQSDDESEGSAFVALSETNWPLVCGAYSSEEPGLVVELGQRCELDATLVTVTRIELHSTSRTDVISAEIVTRVTDSGNPPPSEVDSPETQLQRLCSC
ncbi:hypothetical protein K438DRAFT_1761613 [Mycena galopus ATCC 62051]|nr:hypothetical protein K438DRAFT_1761613 [Mycena galopus ATCC 62051]